MKQRWEVSFSVFKEDGERVFKVTRRLPEHKVTETKMFNDEEEAKIQFEEWLNE